MSKILKIPSVATTDLEAPGGEYMRVCDICKENKPISKINIKQALHYPANYELCTNYATKLKKYIKFEQVRNIKSERSKNADEI